MDFQSQNGYKFPTYNEFRSTYFRQSFSIPESIIYYIAKNPSNSKIYQKLIQTCKYFFITNLILVIHCLRFEENEWKTCTKGPKKIELNKISFKIWISKKLVISSTNPKFASKFISKLYKCDAKEIHFTEQIISFDEFLFLSNKCKRYFSNLTTVKLENGKEAPVEDLIEKLSKLQRFYQ